MPKIDNIEETPNPNAVKFLLKEPVTSGTTRSFHSAEEAAADPLGGALFAVGDVASVFYMDKMVTVEKTEEADWDDLLPRLAVPIRAAESVATNGGAKAAAAAVGGALGALVAYFAFDGYQAATLNWQSFSQVAFAFRVTPVLLAVAIFYALVLGLVGGLFPAVRAARLPVATALRES